MSSSVGKQARVRESGEICTIIAIELAPLIVEVRFGNGDETSTFYREELEVLEGEGLKPVNPG